MADSIYSDLDFQLAHTRSGNVTIQYDSDAVKQAIKTLLTTRKGERIMEPTFGSNLRYLLFQPLDDVTAFSIETEIFNSIERWEPRVSITELVITPDYERSLFVVELGYNIPALNQTDSYTFELRSEA